MAKLMLYRVVREHQGDKPYVTGDERVADPAAVSHLVPHVLEEIGPAPEAGEKAEGASAQTKSEGASPSNKAEGASPSNKAEGAAPARKAARPKPKGK